MKELVTFEELSTKLSAFGLEFDEKAVKRIKTFQGSILEMIQSKVNDQDFKKLIKEKVNLKEHYILLKKVKELEQDTINDLRNMLIGKIQEIELMNNTKASQAELEVIRNNKIGQEELQALESQIKAIQSHIMSLEGEEKEHDPDSDGLTPISNSSKYKRYTRNVHGYGDELYKLIKQEQKKGNSVGLKKHLRYHQLQLNEICDKITYDDDRFENMRKEILLQREQLTTYREENKVLKEKVEKNEGIIKQVDDTLQMIHEFKNQIAMDRDHIHEVMLKAQND